MLRTPGVTVLAWGAQVPDCLASVAMAKKGLGAPSLPPSLAPRRDPVPAATEMRAAVPLQSGRDAIVMAMQAPARWRTPWARGTLGC